MNPSVSGPDPSPLEFPCRWPVKAMTRTDSGALARVLEAIARHDPGFDRNAVSVRPSRQGRYQSITVEVHARSRTHLEAIYRDLRALEVVVMTL